MQTIYIEKREAFFGSFRRDAFFLVDQDGRLMSQPFPTRQSARAEAEAYASDYSDVTVAEGKRP